MTAVNLLQEFDRTTRVLGLSAEDQQAWVQARAERRRLDAAGDRLYEEATLAEVTADIGGHWLDRDGIDTLPGLEPLLGTLLFRESIIVLAGPPGSFKSFVALDWAATVATGKTWQNMASERGRVAYLAGEGSAGFPKRLRAWETAHYDGAKVAIDLFTMGVGLHQPDALVTRALVTSLVEREPDLVIIDTLAQFTPGMNENSAEDMGRFLQTAKRIKERTGACVVIVHHTTKEGGSERGSNSLRGGSDGLYMMADPKTDTKTGKRSVKVVIDRSKDEASGRKIPLELEVVDTELGGSLVIRRVDPFTEPARREPPEGMPSANSTNLVKLLFNVYVSMRETAKGWTKEEIRQVVRESPFNLGANERRQWSRTFGRATKDGYLINPEGTSARWELDTAAVVKEFGFTEEMESYYRDVVLAEDASVDEDGGPVA